MNEEQLLKRKIIDTANQAFNHNIYTYTNFLSINELSSVNKMSNELSFIPYDEWGGNPVCERKIIRFGSEELYGYDAGYPISAIRISPLSVKFAEQLNHRDYLGAIMNLGIERELVGDIIIKVPDAYVYCLSHIADYICDNLDSIKHTHIRCTICTDEIEAIKPELEEIRIIAASKRIDAVVASITRLSRSNSNELFTSKKIFLNGICTENKSQNLKKDDVLVIRGHGKYIFIGDEAETRKGRSYLTLMQYK